MRKRLSQRSIPPAELPILPPFTRRYINRLMRDPSVAQRKLSAEDRRFIEGIASLLTPWGMAPVTAKLYGYLLLCSAPVTLDNIVDTLDISKSSASVAARLLENGQLARRFSEPGSKRIFYEAADTCSSVLRDHAAMLGSVAELMERRASKPLAEAVRKRLTSVGGFYLAMRDAIEEAVKKVGETSGR